jgi:hypothetical protein
MVVVDIISNNNSFTKFVEVEDPLTYTKNEIPKSNNKFKGTVKIKNDIKNNPPIVQIKIELLNNITIIAIKIKDDIVSTNKITKKKKSSTGPISFSLSFNINNFNKLLPEIICLI